MWSAHQGMSLPILVHLLFVMKKPTIGSVTAPQALPMKSTMEAWTALICREEQPDTGVINSTGQTLQKDFHCPWRRYLGNIKQVDLQKEGRGAGSHLLRHATNGKAEFAA